MEAKTTTTQKILCKRNQKLTMSIFDNNFWLWIINNTKVKMMIYIYIWILQKLLYSL